MKHRRVTPMLTRSLLFGSLTACVLTSSVIAQQPAAPGARGGGRGAPEPVEETGVPAVEKVSTTHHTVTINGKTIAYTATAGTMVIRDDDGKPKATVFYVAYTRDQED